MPPYSIAKSDAAGERTIFVEFMLGCLLDAMLNYKPEEDDSEGVQDKVQDKFPELSEKTIDVLDAIKKYPGHNANEIGEQISLLERQVKTYITNLNNLG